jgi:hypothetical protein
MNRTGEKKHRGRKENKKFQDTAAASYLTISKLCLYRIYRIFNETFLQHAWQIVESLCTPCYTPHQHPSVRCSRTFSQIPKKGPTFDKFFNASKTVTEPSTVYWFEFCPMSHVTHAFLRTRCDAYQPTLYQASGIGNRLSTVVSLSLPFYISKKRPFLQQEAVSATGNRFCVAVTSCCLWW